MNTSKAITDRYVFDAYGNDVAPGLHNTTEGNSLRFRWNGSYGYRTLYLLTGQQSTNTATVMHVGARHYSPSLRRWLQRDPGASGSGSPNLYEYCRANPIAYRDWDGLDPEPASGYPLVVVQAALKLLRQSDPKGTRPITARVLIDWKLNRALLGVAKDGCIVLNPNVFATGTLKGTAYWDTLQRDAVAAAGTIAHEQYHLQHDGRLKDVESNFMYVSSRLVWALSLGYVTPVSAEGWFEALAWHHEMLVLSSIAFWRPDLKEKCRSRLDLIIEGFDELYGLHHLGGLHEMGRERYFPGVYR